jgi:hypothetical protein
MLSCLISHISSRARIWKAPVCIYVANECHFALAPTEDPASEDTHIKVLAGTAETILTTDNAKEVLSLLDIYKLCRAVSLKGEMMGGEMFAFLTCIKDQDVRV